MHLLSFETKPAEVINSQKDTLHITVLYYLLIDYSQFHTTKTSSTPKNQIKLIKALAANKLNARKMNF